MPINYTASISPADLKREVDLAGVVLEYGVDLEAELDGSFVGHCPFHDDKNPSFSVYTTEDGSQKWNCWAGCGYGDIYDFIGKLKDVSFTEALSLVKEFRESGGLPTPPDSTTRDRITTVELELILAQASGEGVLPELLYERHIDVPQWWIRNEWKVTDDRVQVWIPHFDTTGQMVGLKKRYHDDWEQRSVPRSDLSSLYGGWKDTRSIDDPVVLCEGESDTWLVSFLLRDTPTVVLGLPSGVRAPTTEWLNFLQGRTVTLLFDSDTAGRKCVSKWLEGAKGSMNLKVAVLPDGSDCNTAGKSVVLQAISDALPWNDLTSITLQELAGKYISTSTQSPISDFVFDVKRTLVMPQNVVYEVAIPTKGTLQQLSADDLISTTRLRTWSAKRMLSWRGSDKNVGELMEVLKSKSVTIPQVKGVDIVGLHDNVYVLPDLTIGSSGYGYVHPEADIHLGEFLHIQEGPWDVNGLTYLTALHLPTVMTPILGWIAAAPLRSLFRQFPILSVTGGSGWGKTTTLRLALGSFGFWVKSPPTLTGSTPHAILSYASSTNAIPIWFDEYRPGARAEAKQTLDQVIRDAFDGSATIKGGLENNRMNVKRMPACAPLIVSGEDAFSETSHVERMVAVSLPREGKSEQALLAVRKANYDGLGYAYLRWLLQSLRSGNLPTLPDLPDRPSHSIAVAEWGYQVLGDFCEEICGYTLEPEFDGSGCRLVQTAARNRPVILEAISLTIGLQDHYDNYISFIDSRDGHGYIKPQSLVQWTKSQSDIVLPGSSRAVVSWLTEMYSAEYVDHPTLRRCLKIPNLQEILRGLDDT